MTAQPSQRSAVVRQTTPVTVRIATKSRPSSSHVFKTRQLALVLSCRVCIEFWKTWNVEKNWIGWNWRWILASSFCYPGSEDLRCVEQYCEFDDNRAHWLVNSDSFEYGYTFCGRYLQAQQWPGGTSGICRCDFLGFDALRAAWCLDRRTMIDRGGSANLKGLYVYRGRLRMTLAWNCTQHRHSAWKYI